MAAQGRNGWKIFGIVVLLLLLIAAIAASAFFLGRGTEGEKGATTPTIKTTPVEASPVPVDVVPEEAGADGEPATDAGEPDAGGTETTATTERYVTGEGEGSTPCVGGFQTTTRTTYWSDGTTDTVTITEPCP